MCVFCLHLDACVVVLVSNNLSIICQTLDSLGRICHYAGAWAKTETCDVYKRGFYLFGIEELLEVWISDCSTASLKLATTYANKRHVLCFQHFRQHLWDAVATFNLADKNSFWRLAMKIMKWRGYSCDNDLLGDIRQLKTLFPGSARIQELLSDLEKYREKLCIFHVSKCTTMMRVASSIAESTHSAIKGGGEMSLRQRSGSAAITDYD
jgi:hypothetical protein